IISEYLKIKIPKSWNEKSIAERRQWIQASEEFRADNDEELIERMQVCAVEIWCEAMGRDVATLSNAIARQINEALESLSGWTRDKYPRRYGVYGNQRGFYKL